MTQMEMLFLAFEQKCIEQLHVPHAKYFSNNFLMLPVQPFSDMDVVSRA